MSHNDNIIHMSFTTGTDVFQSTEQRNNARQLTKAQRYSLAARNLLLSNNRTQFATQTVVETNPNVLNLSLLPNSNVLLLPITLPPQNN